jgi:hypothetical protein
MSPAQRDHGLAYVVKEFVIVLGSDLTASQSGARNGKPAIS